MDIMAAILAPNRRQAITWTDDDPVDWRYAALTQAKMKCQLSFNSHLVLA